MLVGLFMVAASDLNAEPAKTAPETRRDLVIVVTENLVGPRGESHGFNRVARVFTNVFEARKWPVKIRAERFAANTKTHATELQVFLKGIRQDIPGEYEFYAWVTFADRGKKLDMGIVKGTYYPRFLEPMDDVLDGAVKAAAEKIANKIQPILLRSVQKTGS